MDLNIGELILTNISKCDQQRHNFIQQQGHIKDSLKDLILSANKIKQISDVFKSELESALAEKPSSLQMENTYIPELPDGSENGVFLALDLGGTNFRVILLDVHLGNIIREEVKHYHISDNLRLGCGIKLFDYLAKCLLEFIAEQNLTNIEVPLGFTFSFPMKQHSLDSAELVTWTKSFKADNVQGQDVVRLLRESLNRLGENKINVLAILNDTTGTLVQGARLDKNTRIGMIIGTGSNACYMERADRVQHWETQRHGEKNVIIDIEWGAFGDNGVLDFIKTHYDVDVDKASLLANSFTFEKYIGGKYLGEMARVILWDLVKKKLLFKNAVTKTFPGPGTFESNNVSFIDQDTVDDTNKRTIEIFNEFGYKYKIDFDDDDIIIIKYVIEIISSRAARLVSICTSVLLNRMDDDDITIAIDGSVYKHHPRLKKWMEIYTQELVPNKKFHLMLAEDGSGKGAGIVAAIALKIRQRNYD